jgi:hypothetical protein
MRSLLAQMAEVDLAPLLDQRKFIYVLVLGDEIVYVGQTGNVLQRCLAHRSGATYANGRVMCAVKEFDRAFQIEVAVGDVDAYEGALIRRFNPRYCGASRADESRDVEILARFGLEPDPVARDAFKARIGKVFADAHRASRLCAWTERKWHRRLERTLYRAAKNTAKRLARAAS